MTRARAVGVLCIFALGLVAVWAVPLLQRDLVTEPAAWIAAAHKVEVTEPGTLVVIHPPWRDDVVQALRTAAARDPRFLRGATVTTAFAPQQGAPWPPLVVLRERDGVPLPQVLRRAVAATTDAGHGLLIEVMRATGSTAAGAAGAAGDSAVNEHDLLFDLTGFATEVSTPAGTIPCPLVATEQRHVCTGQPAWMHQGYETLSVDGVPVSCMWAHPPKSGALVFRLAGRALTGGVRLDLALSDTAAQTPSGAPVSARLQVGDAHAEVTRQGTRGFGSARVPAPAAGAAVDITVTISTPNDAQRHACIRLVDEPLFAPSGARAGGSR